MAVLECDLPVCELVCPRRSGLGRFQHLCGIDFDFLNWAVAGTGGDRTDLHDDIQAGGVGGLAENRVLAIQVRNARHADKELRTGRVRVAGTSHRQHTRFMRLGIKFLLNGVAGAPGAISQRAAHLNHEAGNDAVENNPVVETYLRQGQNVLHVAGSDVGVHVEQHFAHRRVEFNLVGLLGEIEILLGFGHFSLSVTRHATLSLSAGGGNCGLSPGNGNRRPASGPPWNVTKINFAICSPIMLGIWKAGVKTEHHFRTTRRSVTHQRRAPTQVQATGSAGASYDHMRTCL